tara:strand:- start:6562 stop:6867 length:306 start_codon:yes stop_codon:yes gene_type:complete
MGVNPYDKKNNFQKPENYDKIDNVSSNKQYLVPTSYDIGSRFNYGLRGPLVKDLFMKDFNSLTQDEKLEAIYDMLIENRKILDNYILLAVLFLILLYLKIK